MSPARPLVGIVLAAFSVGCAPEKPGSAPMLEPGALERPALAGDGLIHVVIEIPAGTNLKREVDKETAELAVEEIDGEPRVVDYLGYPGSYGLVPGTLLAAASGGDGDPLDALVLGPALAVGSVVVARPIGVLRLTDTGEVDDKLICVPLEGPFSELTGLSRLIAEYPGVLEIVETWFANYKGAGRIVTAGFDDEVAAMAMVEAAALSPER